MDATKVCKEKDTLPDSSHEHRVCKACLCATRTTYKLDYIMLKCYMNILAEAQLVSDMCMSPSVCWECLSVLRRWTHFREQVKQSFAILHSSLERCDQKDTNKFLISEVSRPGRLKCCFVFSVNICPGENDKDSTVMTAALSDEGDHKQLPASVKEEVEEYPAAELIVDNIRTTLFIEPFTSIGDQYFDDRKESGGQQCEEFSTGNTSCMGVSHKSGLEKREKSVKRFHSDRRPHQCSTAFETDKQLTRHKNTYIKDKTHRCHLCRKTFMKVNSLHAHIITHTDPSVKLPFKCEVCLRAFKHESNCLQHEKVHSGETVTRNPTKFECPVCMKTLSTKNSLQRHMFIHTTREYNWNCELCDNKFMTKLVLDNHRLRLHSNVKAFQCEICPKAYKVKAELNVHMLSHSGLNQFQCNECLKRFPTKKYLRFHLVSHSDKKPFQCDDCLKFFKKKLELRKHTVIHTGKRAFRCEVCNKSFITKKHMTRHQIVHTRERPFQCNVCSNWYARKDYLLAHMRSHTGNTAHSSASIN